MPRGDVKPLLWHCASAFEVQLPPSAHTCQAHPAAVGLRPANTAVPMGAGCWPAATSLVGLRQAYHSHIHQLALALHTARYPCGRAHLTAPLMPKAVLVTKPVHMNCATCPALPPTVSSCTQVRL